MVPVDFSNPRIEIDLADACIRYVVDNTEEFVETARGNTQVKEARIKMYWYYNMPDFYIYYNAIGQALSELKFLEKVEFDATEIDNANGWSAITYILNQTKDRGIKAMHFELCGSPDIELESVTADEMLREHTTLEELKVFRVYGGFDDDDEAFYNPFPLSLASLPNLNSVTIQNDSRFLNLHNFTAPTSGKLLKLSLEGFMFAEDLYTVLADAVFRNPKLEVLEFRKCYLEGNLAAALLFEKIGELSSLRTLYIDHPANHTAYYVLAKYFSRDRNSLNEVFISTRSPGTRNLSVPLFAVTGLHNLLLAMTSYALLPLVTLDMKIDNPGAVMVLNDELTRSCLGATTALKNLKVSFSYNYGSGPPISDETWSNICSAVAKNTKLTRFEFESVGRLDISGFFRAMPALSMSNTLNSLRICVSPYHSNAISIEDWYNICTAVAKSMTVTRLEVGNLRIYESEFRHGMSILNNETEKLESLRVSVYLSGQGFEPFLDVLKDFGKHSALVELNLHPKISVSEDDAQLDVFLKTPLKALRETYTLTCFPFYFAETVSPQDQAHIESETKTILKLNRHGRRYMLDENPKKESGVALLLAVVDDLDCIFYHIKENPILFCCHDNDRRGSLENSATLDTNPVVSLPLP